MKDVERTSSFHENRAVTPRVSCGRNRGASLDKHEKAGREHPVDNRVGDGHIRMVLAGIDRTAVRCRPPRPVGGGTDGKRETSAD